MVDLQPRRSPWYLLTGLILGAVAGLLIAWVVAPVELVDTQPFNLQENFKAEYRALIAAAYVANGDLGRAQARLALLGDDDPTRTLAAQAQLTLAQGGSPERARALGLLAAALDDGVGIEISVTPSSTAEITATSGLSVTPGETAEATGTSAVTGSPTWTATIQPTSTPTATQGAAYELQLFEPICDPGLTKPLIQVLVLDAAGQPVAGVAIRVSWEGGEDIFFTGMKPELGVWYADYEMAPGVFYTLEIVEGGEPVSNLTANECEGAGGETFLGSWRVTFGQP